MARWLLVRTVAILQWSTSMSAQLRARCSSRLRGAGRGRCLPSPNLTLQLHNPPVPAVPNHSPRSSPLRSQPRYLPTLPRPSPCAQMRRIQPLPAQQRPKLSRTNASVRILKHSPLILDAEPPPYRLLCHFHLRYHETCSHRIHNNLLLPRLLQ